MRSLSTSAVTLKQVEVFLLEVDNVEGPRTGVLKEALFPAVQQKCGCAVGRPCLQGGRLESNVTARRAKCRSYVSY